MIHLAALQVPFCRADPPLGARVNVLGTVNVFEAAKARPQLAPIVYASLDRRVRRRRDDGRAPGHDLRRLQARERVDRRRVPRARTASRAPGLRPHTVYGVGRDQGVTSAPTTAMLAAAAGTAVHDPVRRRRQLQLARDVARAFVAASLAAHEGAAVHNLPGPHASRSRRSSRRSAAGRDRLRRRPRCRSPRRSTARRSRPRFPGFAETPLAEGVAATVDRFRALLAEGLVQPPAQGA